MGTKRTSIVAAPTVPPVLMVKTVQPTETVKVTIVLLELLVSLVMIGIVEEDSTAVAWDNIRSNVLHAIGAHFSVARVLTARPGGTKILHFLMMPRYGIFLKPKQTPSHRG